MISVKLSPAQVSDVRAFDDLWLDALNKLSGIKHVVADKGYDALKVKTSIVNSGRNSIIPRRSNAFFSGVVDKVRYKTRSAIERFYAHVKENKRLVARYDKLDSTFIAFFIIACIKIFKLLC